MKLYSYFRSSAAYRVRIALQLKGLTPDIIPIHLVKGEQNSSDYLELNPQGLVPALQDKGQLLTQSLAIIEYLDEVYPDVPLLPNTAADRAIVRAMASTIACEIHPLNNLRVLKYLTNTFHVNEEQKLAWYAHWIQEGFRALEAQLQKYAGEFCFGDKPTLADCCLVPQVFNAKRFDVDLSSYRAIHRVTDNCLKLEAFIKADPSNQPDAA